MFVSMMSPREEGCVTKLDSVFSLSEPPRSRYTFSKEQKFVTPSSDSFLV